MAELIHNLAFKTAGTRFLALSVRARVIILLHYAICLSVKCAETLILWLTVVD